MKHISDISKIPIRNQSDQLSTEYSDEAKRNIQEIFMLMKANYGHKWTSNLATDQDVKITARLWLYHFHQYNKDVLHTALAYAFQQYDWPPTVKQFRTEIRAVLREQQALELLLLPAPERRSGLSDTARKHLDKLKSSLGLT